MSNSIPISIAAVNAAREFNTIWYNNASYGKSNIMIAEADESDRSFLMLYPSIAVITNIDYEHISATIEVVVVLP